MRFAFLPALALIACDPSANPGAFDGGNFQFTTRAVADGCLDGGMDLLFMPEGAGTPNEFADPIYIPGFDELPMTYDVSLQEPFNDMEVTVTGTADTRLVSGAQNDGVEFDADNYPGCTVDNVISVALTIDSADELTGTATLATSNFTGSTCPVPDEDPCDVVLTLTGARVN